MKPLALSNVRISALARPLRLLLLALLLAPGGGSAAEPPSRIKLQVPDTLNPGEAAKIVVELTGENGRTAAAVEDLQIAIRGLKTLSPTTRVTVPAGSSRAEVPIRAPKPGLWRIEASSRGLLPDSKTMVCLEKAPRSTMADFTPGSEIKAADDAETSFGTGEVLLPPPLPPVSGRVELIAQPSKVRRVRGGWESRVEAFWFQKTPGGEVPAQSLQDVNVSLILEGGTGSATVDPSSLSIPNGSFRSQTPARISARSPEKAVLQAFYPGGRSNPVEIEFLSSVPSSISFAGVPTSFRGLASAGTDLYVRLLDDDRQPVFTDRPVPVDVAVEGPTGTRSYSVTVPAGAIQAKVALEMNRPGRYTLQASAPGLRESDRQTVRFAIDWLLISVSLLGGVLGSLTRVLYRRERPRGKGLARVLALGVAAAFLVLLLALFGLLSILGDVLPAEIAEGLQKVSATSLFGVLLLGYVAGLVFDMVLGRFLGGEGGGRKPRRRRKEPTPVPEPKGA